MAEADGTPGLSEVGDVDLTLPSKRQLEPQLLPNPPSGIHEGSLQLSRTYNSFQ